MKNFLDNYMLYSASNEAPATYHFWAGLSALSHLIGARVYTHLGGRLTFYPNMYILLVGEPGFMKSTALYQARDLVETIPYIAQAPASTSKEGIVKLMTMKDSPAIRSYEPEKGQYVRYSQLAIFASEFVSLLNAAGNPNGTVEFLTDIWDRTGRTYRQFFMSSGDSDIVSPYISILAGLTPTLLKNLITSKVISMGMSRRNLVIYSDKPSERAIPFPETTPEQEEAWRHCVTHAKVLQGVWGKFEWEPEAKQLYDSWYRGFKPKVMEEVSPILRNFFMTKAEYVIKISMLLAVGEVPPKLIHTRANFQRALDLVTSVERGAVTLFEGSGANRLTTVIGEVELWLKNHPGWHMEFDLLKYFWKDFVNAKEEIKSIMDQLVRLGKVEMKDEITKQGVFRKVHYINGAA